MSLQIVHFNDPALRKKGAKVTRFDAALRSFADDMVATMHAAAGIGLAAQQVGHALQLTVIDVREAKDRPSWLELDGKPADVNDLMPLVLINPELKPDGEPVAGGEGCLSFPEIFADISRPEAVTVKALDKKGKPIEFRCGGLLARVIQHDADHLNGVLFIDRMTRQMKEELRPELDALQANTRAELEAAEKSR